MITPEKVRIAYGIESPQAILPRLKSDEEVVVSVLCGPDRWDAVLDIQAGNKVKNYHHSGSIVELETEDGPLTVNLEPILPVVAQRWVTLTVPREE